MGMMAGLGVLMVYGFRIKTLYSSGEGEEHEEFDIFDKVRDAEWDTLFFFFGVVFAVGGFEPINATPAAEPTDNIEPPVPAVKVTNNH
jgi:Na+/H+ antiporter NhaD/arsenite permease-like protein